MVHHEFVFQPQNGRRYLDLLAAAFEVPSVDTFRAAVAYATVNGVGELGRFLQGIDHARWIKARKEWLVGIDWCRTDPLALAFLAHLPSSEVRIHEGRALVTRPGCTPSVAFHPKTFVCSGADVRAVIVGSGNLSRNGLTLGHEVGSLVVVQQPLGEHEERLWASCESARRWFVRLWNTATPLHEVEDGYVRQYEATKELTDPTATDDDSAPTEQITRRRHAISPERIRQLRACKNLWIQAGNLHENRGPGRPGNQLMMSPMTRVFFGFPATDVATDTLLGYVRIRFDRRLRDDCSLRFSNNSMDVLTLPVPGSEGPETYDQKTLLFQEKVDSRGSLFDLTLGTTREVQEWRRRSRAINGLVTMTSGREWGIF